MHPLLKAISLKKIFFKMNMALSFYDCGKNSCCVERCKEDSKNILILPSKITPIFFVCAHTLMNTHSHKHQFIFLQKWDHTFSHFDNISWLSPMLTNVDLPHRFKWMPFTLQNECAIVNLTRFLWIKFNIKKIIIKSSIPDFLCMFLAMSLVIS